jgi:hypothetical protein
MTRTLTGEQIDSLRLGAACDWFAENQELRRTEEAAMSYPVIGLPERMTAMIHRARPGRWYFAVHGYPQEDFKDNPMEDKEAALEGLKEWLKTQQWR